MNGKRKGSGGERELCAYLTGEGFPARRNNQMFVGGGGNPDISARGLSEYHIEVKRVERLNIGAAMAQAERDAAGKIPTVIHRQNRRPWRITLNLSDFLQVVKRNERQQDAGSTGDA